MAACKLIIIIINFSAKAVVQNYAELAILQEGEADVSCDRGNGKLTKGSCVLIKDGEKYES